MVKGCYLFKIDQEILALPLELLCISRLRFVIKERREYNFYKFYGLDSDINEQELEENLLDYFSRDVTYPPRNIHPTLEDSNKVILSQYPVLFERIRKIQVAYLEKSFEEIKKKDPKDYENLFF
jgi:hypothetical protein